MKKFIRTLSILILLPLSYLILAIILSYSYGLFLLLNTGTSQSLLSTSLNSVINSIELNYYTFYLISGSIIIGLLFLMKGNLLKKCKFNKITFKNIIYISMLSIFCQTFIILLMNLFPSFYEFKSITQELLNIPTLQVGILVLILPIFEEILFRGVIFGYLRKNYKLVTAVILQGIVFGIFHMNIIQGIYTAILGILLALIYNYTNSLFNSILFHMFFNFLGIIVFPYIYKLSPNILYILIPVAIVSFIFIIFLKNTINILSITKK